MIHETLKRIELEIENGVSDPQHKTELLNLLDNLKVEIATIHQEDAKSITNFTETSISEAIRDSRDDELLTHALEGMKLSVKRFEVSHPGLISVINNIGRMLSDVGL